MKHSEHPRDTVGLYITIQLPKSLLIMKCDHRRLRIVLYFTFLTMVIHDEKYIIGIHTKKLTHTDLFHSLTVTEGIHEP